MKRDLVGISIVAGFFIAEVLTLSSYGMHEDSPFHFLRGQYELQKLLTEKRIFGTPGKPMPVFFVPGQRISLYKPNASEELFAPPRPFESKGMRDLDGPRQTLYKHDAWTGNKWDDPNNIGHPGVSDTLMALTNRVFYETVGVLGDVEAYHLYVVIVSTMSVAAVYWFTKTVYGRRAALFAALGLATYPFYFAESHFGIKDTVQMGFFTVSVVSFYFFIRKISLKWFIAFILSVFLALGTKWNIVFLPFIILPWLFLIRKDDEGKSRWSKRALVIYGIIAMIAPLLLLVASWPFLWTNPVAKLRETFEFYRGLAVLDPYFTASPRFQLPLGLNATGVLRILAMTPPVTLLFFVVGLIALLARKITSRFKEQWLVLLWFVVPVLRGSLDRVDRTGSIRQFVEFLPAFAVIAGVGGALFVDAMTKLFGRVNPLAIRAGVLAVFFIWPVILLVRLHPNQNVYFNSLAGGLRGAQASGLYTWWGTYDNVYRQGANWFNAQAPADATLAILDGTMLALSPLWLRNDISISSSFSGFDQSGEYVMSLVYPIPPSVFEYLYLERFQSPAYVLAVDGVPLLKIWKNDVQTVRPPYDKEIQIEEGWTIVRRTAEGRKTWDLAFSNSIPLTRLILRYPLGCPVKRGVWSIFRNGKEQFINPRVAVLSPEDIEFDFPADMADAVRLWDVEKNSCLLQAEVRSIFALASIGDQ